MVTSLFPPESELETVRASTTRSPNAQTAGQCTCKSFIFNTVWLTKCGFDNLAGFTWALGPDERPRGQGQQIAGGELVRGAPTGRPATEKGDP
jgi:hypothetical protein